ncbi:hypothetical protein Tco_0975048 [Tanacetum coccineum]|uniref:Uncharacterized protein n=1 Tax=Tanacetum coccineum TaxID=301880 RepID=A0ABQ5EDF0_9ASTR
MRMIRVRSSPFREINLEKDLVLTFLPGLARYGKKAIEEDEIKPILIEPNPSPINSNFLTISPSLKDFTVHIPYTNVKTFKDDVLPNHVGDKELKSSLWHWNWKDDKEGEGRQGCIPVNIAVHSGIDDIF